MALEYTRAPMSNCLELKVITRIERKKRCFWKFISKVCLYIIKNLFKKKAMWPLKVYSDEFDDHIVLAFYGYTK
jgi:hypothetical protein